MVIITETRGSRICWARMRVLLVLVAGALLVQAGKESRSRKKANNPPDPDQSRSLEDWKALSHEALLVACQLAGVTIEGSDDDLATLLYQHHQQMTESRRRTVANRYDPYAIVDTNTVPASAVGVSQQGEAVQQQPNQDVLEEILQFHANLENQHATAQIATTTPDNVGVSSLRAQRVSGATWTLATGPPPQTARGQGMDGYRWQLNPVDSLPRSLPQPTSIPARLSAGTETQFANALNGLATTVTTSLEKILSALVAMQGGAQAQGASVGTTGGDAHGTSAMGGRFAAPAAPVIQPTLPGTPMPPWLVSSAQPLVSHGLTPVVSLPPVSSSFPQPPAPPAPVPAWQVPSAQPQAHATQSVQAGAFPPTTSPAFPTVLPHSASIPSQPWSSSFTPPVAQGGVYAPIRPVPPTVQPLSFPPPPPPPPPAPPLVFGHPQPQPPNPTPQVHPQANSQLTNNLFPGGLPGVPRRFIDQIHRGECINFHALYTALLYGTTASPGFSLVMDENPAGDFPVMSFVQKNVAKNKITTFAAWIRTWNTYMSIAAAFRPHLLTELIGYQQIISRFATTYPVRFWLAYDAAFRQKMANNPHLSWGIEDNELYIMFLRSAPLLPSVNAEANAARFGDSGGSSSQPSQQRRGRGPCFNCWGFGHVAAQCQYAPRGGGPVQQQSNSQTSTGGQARQSSGTQAQTGYTTAPPFHAPQRASSASGVCFAWNNGSRCPPGCRRDHRCILCNGLHRRDECTQFPPPAGN